MGTGKLIVQITTAGEELSGAPAKITVAKPDGTTLHTADVDASGNAGPFELSAPDVSLSMDPSNRLPAFSIYAVTVEKRGFITERIHNVEILDTQETILPIHMRPQPADGDLPDNETYLPPPSVMTEEPYLKTGATEPSERGRAIGKPVYIPDYITVHLGAPSNAGARNVRVPFRDYIKNVASSEIYATWPRNSLIANIHAITTFALNRVYSEWYRSRGYNFDITNSTAYDQFYRENGPVFENIHQLTEQYFNVYAHRNAFQNPFFTQFCNGSTVTCPGLSQWGTVDLANRGYTPLQILRNYYPKDLVLSVSENIQGIESTYPGYALSLGSSGDAVRRVQNFLNRIRVNYPLIPKISNVSGRFDAETEKAVRTFQSIFHLDQDGIVGPATWNKLTSIYTGVTKLAELDSEGERAGIGETPPSVVLREGARGEAVREMQYILEVVSAFYDTVPSVVRDGVFDAQDKNAVVEFQRTFKLSPDGIVGPATWSKLYAVYRGIKNNAPVPPVVVTPPPVSLPPYPGTLLREGSRGESVRTMQTYLNAIGKAYPNIPVLGTDGIMGPATKGAVIAFQRQFMLSPDGIIGPATWNKVTEIYRTVMGR